MARTPAFQFYPGDWRNNSNLRRCTEAARGAWMDVLCVLHDADEYGVARWPLAELARSAGVPLKLLKELVAKEVLKGGDKGHEGYTYTPRTGGVNGPTVQLIDKTTGPIWFSSRFVRDDHIRKQRGKSSQFSEDKQPPKGTPKGGFGGDLVNGPSSSSAEYLSLPPNPPDGIDPYPNGFSDFIAHYPNRSRAVDAETVWNSLGPSGPEIQTKQEISVGVNLWLQSPRWKAGMIVNPDKWLRNREWKNEPPKGKVTHGNAGSRRRTHAEEQSDRLKDKFLDAYEADERSRLHEEAGDESGVVGSIAGVGCGSAA